MFQYSFDDDDVKTLLLRARRAVPTISSDLTDSLIQDGISANDHDDDIAVAKKIVRTGFSRIDFERISDEGLSYILSFLDCEDIFSVMITCKRLYKVSRCDLLWKKKFEKEIGSTNSRCSNERKVEWINLFFQHKLRKENILHSHESDVNRWNTILCEFEKSKYYFSSDCVNYLRKRDLPFFKNKKKELDVIVEECTNESIPLLNIEDIRHLLDDDLYLDYLLESRDVFSYFITSFNKWLEFFKNLQKTESKDKFYLTIFYSDFFFRVVNKKRFFYLFEDVLSRYSRTLLEFLQTRRVYHHVIENEKDLERIVDKSNQIERKNLLDYVILFEKSRRKLTRTIPQLREFIKLFKPNEVKSVLIDLFLDISFLSKHPLQEILSTKMFVYIKQEFLNMVTSRKRIFKRLNLNDVKNLILLLSHYPSQIDEILRFYYGMKIIKCVSEFEEISIQFGRYNSVFLDHLLSREGEIERLVKCNYDVRILNEKLRSRELRKKLSNLYEEEEGCIIL